MTHLRLSTLDVIVTREVRWFVSGPLPSGVRDWFTEASAGIGRERRVDWYDVDFARDGVGVKRRNSEAIEAKFLVSRTGIDDLAPRMAGDVEDWLKVITPRDGEVGTPAVCHFAVEKDIITRRYAAPAPDAAEAGCEIELAAITAGSETAWTLCFETFGNPELRGGAFEAGLSGFLADTPLPDHLSFTSDASSGYPAWVSALS